LIYYIIAMRRKHSDSNIGDKFSPELKETTKMGKMEKFVFPCY